MVKDGLRFFRLKAFLVILFSLISLLSFNAYAGINDDLGQAAEEGDTSKVAELLSSGAEVTVKGDDVTVKGDDGRTALMWAAEGGYTDIIQLLKQAGASE